MKLTVLYERSYPAKVSRCEEEDNKHRLDDCQDGDPAQEDVDEGLVRGL